MGRVQTLDRWTAIAYTFRRGRAAPSRSYGGSPWPTIPAVRWCVLEPAANRPVLAGACWSRWGMKVSVISVGLRWPSDTDFDTVSPAGRPLKEADQLTDGVVTVLGMAKRKLVMDFVLIAASVSRLRQIAGAFEIADQLCRRSFCHADGLSDVPETRVWVGSDAHQHVRVVGDEPPNMIIITGNTVHET